VFNVNNTALWFNQGVRTKPFTVMVHLLYPAAGGTSDYAFNYEDSGRVTALGNYFLAIATGRWYSAAGGGNLDMSYLVSTKGKHTLEFRAGVSTDSAIIDGVVGASAASSPVGLTQRILNIGYNLSKAETYYAFLYWDRELTAAESLKVRNYLAWRFP
jgi:hypothetical protein